MTLTDLAHQKVHQDKIEPKSSLLNQYVRSPVQSTPAHQTSRKRRPRTSFFVPALQPQPALFRLPSDRRHGPVYQQIHRISGLQTAQRRAALGAQSGAAECITNLGLARAQQQGGLK